MGSRRANLLSAALSTLLARDSFRLNYFNFQLALALMATAVAVAVVYPAFRMGRVHAVLMADARRPGTATYGALGAHLALAATWVAVLVPVRGLWAAVLPATVTEAWYDARRRYRIPRPWLA